MRTPPDDIKPEELFRLLLTIPYPTTKFNHQLFEDMGYYDVYVRAISSSEFYATNYMDLPFICLVDKNKKQVFNSSYEVQDCMDSREYNSLVQDVIKGLQSFPLMGYSNSNAWGAVLEEGAKHSSNFHSMLQIGSCYDATTLGDYIRFIPRPDRYFGVPLNQLLDCHTFAYNAARSVYEKLVKKEK